MSVLTNNVPPSRTSTLLRSAVFWPTTRFPLVIVATPFSLIVKVLSAVLTANARPPQVNVEVAPGPPTLMVELLDDPDDEMSDIWPPLVITTLPPLAE